MSASAETDADEPGDTGSGGSDAQADQPGVSHPADWALRQIVVIGDGTAPDPATVEVTDLNASDAPTPGPETPVQGLQAALAGDAGVIQRLAGVPTVARAADEWGTAPEFAAQILQLPTPAAAIYVTRTDRSRARTVQRLVEQAGGPPVLTDEDATAIALTAAALLYLRRLGRDPYHSKILIAGAIRMPILSPLLLACGFPDLTLWNVPDAIWFPLHRVARDADVVIDLAREDPPGDPAGTSETGTVELDLDRPEGSVITRHRLDSRALVAPGLLRAVVEHPAGALHFGLGLYQVCAEAVVRAMPPRRRPHDTAAGAPIPPAAAQAVADAVAHALHAALTAET